MSDGLADLPEEDQKAFLELADRFIDLANRAGADMGVQRVSAAMLYATSRFNAFVAHVDGYEPEHEEAALGYFTEQYAGLLKEHLADKLVADPED